MACPGEAVVGCRHGRIPPAVVRVWCDGGDGGTVCAQVTTHERAKSAILPTSSPDHPTRRPGERAAEDASSPAAGEHRLRRRQSRSAPGVRTHELTVLRDEAVGLGCA